MKVIKCKNVTKKYKNKVVLDNIDLDIEEGKIYGLIGRNGAGKTTLLSLIAAHNPVTDGSIMLDDEIIWENPNALEQICFSWQIPSASPSNTKEFLTLGELYYPNWDTEYANRLVELFEIDIKKSISKLSKGMQSMVTIIIALASKAKFTFIDEPTAGLDVISRDLFYKLLIEEYTETNRTFVISTHIIDEAADVFEEVIILKDNKVLIKENTQDLLNRAFYVSGKEEVIDKVTANMKCYHKESIGRSKKLTVLLEEGENIEETDEITIRPVTLQSLFVALCGKEV